MTFTLKELSEIVWPYYRPAWIKRLREYGLKVDDDIPDDKLKLLIKLWNDAWGREEE